MFNHEERITNLENKMNAIEELKIEVMKINLNMQLLKSELRSEIKEQISELRSEIKGEVSELKGEIKGIKGELAGIKVWMAIMSTLTFANLSLVFGLIYFMVNHLPTLK